LADFTEFQTPVNTPPFFEHLLICGGECIGSGEAPVINNKKERKKEIIKEDGGWLVSCQS